jgi:hypothetical protein
MRLCLFLKERIHRWIHWSVFRKPLQSFDKGPHNASPVLFSIRNDSITQLNRNKFLVYLPYSFKERLNVGSWSCAPVFFETTDGFSLNFVWTSCQQSSPHLCTFWFRTVVRFPGRSVIGFFLFATGCRPALGTTQPPIQWLRAGGDSFPRG